MALKQGVKARTIAAVLTAGFVSSLLAGCSGRDTDAAEKLAATNAAAARAETAAKRAEAAAAKLTATTANATVTEEPADAAPEDDRDQQDSNSGTSGNPDG